MAAGYVQAGLTAFELINGAQQAEIMRGQAALNRQITDMNADLIDLDAYNAEKKGFSESARYQSTIDETIGKQRSNLAAANVDVNFGTAAELQSEAKLTGMLNQMDMVSHAHDVAMGYKNQARNLRLQGQINSVQGELNAQATQNASVMNAGRQVMGYYTQRPSKKTKAEADGEY